MTIAGEEWRGMDGGRTGTDGGESDSILRDARRNIVRHRQREVILKLVDFAGRPLAGQPVQITQLRSDFPFGDNLWDLDRLFRFNQHETDTGRYWRLRFTELFNAANCLCYWTERPVNDGAKTEDIQGEPRLDGFRYCTSWAAGEGLIVKGHPLFWSLPKAVPAWLMRYDVATRMKFAEVRVRNLVANQRGRIRIWDAVNEPLWEAAFANLENRHWPHVEPAAAMADYIEPVLRWCRQEAPETTYLVNDYGLELDPPGGAPKAKDGTAVTAALQRRRMIELTSELRRRGVPPDGIGMQAHTGGAMTAQQQWQVYDELTEAGLPLHLTEFWPPKIDDPAELAEYVADYLTAAYGHPSIQSIFCWGVFGLAVTWKEHSSHELTPLYYRLRKLLREEWMTRTNGVTDDQGIVRFRGFFGQYCIQLAQTATQIHVAAGVEGVQTVLLTTVRQ